MLPPPLPIITTNLFSVLDRHLLDLLRSLSPEEWELATSAPLWKIKDVAAHLLDGNLRGISMGRDGYFGTTAENIDSYQNLVQFLNKLNHSWVTAAQRISPALLIDLLESTGKQYCEYLKTLDPYAPAIFSVAWAGEQASLNWFHIAREYTEKWHHQQQIRFAVGQEALLLGQELYYPCLDAFMRALPYHYQNVTAPEDTIIRFIVSGISGHWYLCHRENQWQLTHSCDLSVTCEVELEGAIAWRIFTKGISPEQSRAHVHVTGSQELGEKILSMLTVMA